LQLIKGNRLKEESEKICQSCGRPFSNRKKWEGRFHEIKYCSKTCSSRRVPKKSMAMIISHLESLKNGTIVELKEILNHEDQDNTKKLEEARCASRLLASEGKIIVMQNNKKVSSHSFKGPIQVKLS
jgi:hypothetical protein